MENICEWQNCKESGKFAIPAKILIDTLKKLPNQPLTININEETKACIY